MESISFKGLLLLEKMKDKPVDYKEMVMNYLQYKQDWINSGHSTPHNIDVFIEAVNTGRRMGVIWKMTRLSF